MAVIPDSKEEDRKLENRAGNGADAPNTIKKATIIPPILWTLARMLRRKAYRTKSLHTTTKLEERYAQGFL